VIHIKKRKLSVTINGISIILKRVKKTVDLGRSITEKDAYAAAERIVMNIKSAIARNENNVDCKM
jgi:hypothetical protein